VSGEVEIRVVQTEGTGTSPHNPAKYQLEQRHIAIQMSMAPGDDVIN